MMGFHVPIVGMKKPQNFPTVVTRITSQQNSSGTNHPVSLPASLVEGNLIVIGFQIKDALTITFPAGWNSLTANNGRQQIFYKTVEAADVGVASINVTLSGNNRSTHMTYQVSNWKGTPENASATGSSANPDPPSLAPSWGTKKTLWLVFAGQGGSNRSYSAAPTNYTNLQSEVPTDTASASAERLLEASSEDPGTFTMSASASWWAQTVAIQGA